MSDTNICKTCKNYKYRLSFPPKDINKPEDFLEWEKPIPCIGCVHWVVSDLYEADVKPCPFCGEEAELRDLFGGEEAELRDLQAGTDHSIYDHSIYVVGCSRCGIFTKSHLSKEEAIKYWNRRV